MVNVVRAASPCPIVIQFSHSYLFTLIAIANLERAQIAQDCHGTRSCNICYNMGSTLAAAIEQQNLIVQC